MFSVTMMVDGLRLLVNNKKGEMTMTKKVSRNNLRVIFKKEMDELAITKKVKEEEMLSFKTRIISDNAKKVTMMSSDGNIKTMYIDKDDVQFFRDAGWKVLSVTMRDDNAETLDKILVSYKKRLVNDGFNCIYCNSPIVAEEEGNVVGPEELACNDCFTFKTIDSMIAMDEEEVE